MPTLNPFIFAKRHSPASFPTPITPTAIKKVYFVTCISGNSTSISIEVETDSPSDIGVPKKASVTFIKRGDIDIAIVAKLNVAGLPFDMVTMRSNVCLKEWEPSSSIRRTSSMALKSISSVQFSIGVTAGGKDGKSGSSTLGVSVDADAGSGSGLGTIVEDSIELFLKVNDLREVKKKISDGTVPFSKLSFRFRLVSFCNKPKDDGIVPDRACRLRLKLSKCFKDPTSDGMGPVRKFPAKLICSSIVIAPTSEGILPSKPLDSILNTVNCVKVPRVAMNRRDNRVG